MNAEFTDSNGKPADDPDDVGPLDDSFPMLTEVVSYQPPASATSPTSPASPTSPTSPMVSGEAREALERRLTTQVLARLADSPELLDNATREALRTAAERVAAALAAELQVSLEQALDRLVEPAIREAVRDALDPLVRAAVHDVCASGLAPAGSPGSTGTL